MARIFISYDRESRAIATSLATDIELLGHTAWFDQEIGGGRVWWDQILAQVRECDVFMFVLNPQTLDSAACKSEYLYAADLGKAILPVLVSDQVATDVLPPALAQIQFVDYLKPDREAAFRLARSLNSIPPSRPLPESLPTPPRAPISYLGSLTERIESTASLSYEEQSVLLADLRVSLRDPGASDHIQKLLATLRKRRDLFATFAEEVDDLIVKVGKLHSAPVVTQQPVSVLPKALDFSFLPRLNSVRVAIRRLRWPETRPGAALRGAIAGWVVGSGLLALNDALYGLPSQRLYFGSGGDLIVQMMAYLAVAGAILGKKGWASLIAFLAVLGCGVLGIALRSYDLTSGSRFLAIVVAIIALVWGALAKRSRSE